MFVQLQNEFIDFKARQAKGVVCPKAVGVSTVRGVASLCCAHDSCVSVCESVCVQGLMNAEQKGEQRSCGS